MTTKSIHTKIAYKAIKEYLYTGTTKKIESEKIPEQLKIKAACFVTLKTEDGKLRGCIGTLHPVYKNLYTEIIKNAVASAVRDYRFDPVTADELDTLKISVEVLQTPERISGPEDLNPEKYGAIISDMQGRRGVLLPGIEGVDTPEEQIRIIKRKAGIFQKSNNGLIFHRFKTEKYY